jgi:uncharacterized protein (TIGR03435 family)
MKTILLVAVGLSVTVIAGSPGVERLRAQAPAPTKGPDPTFEAATVKQNKSGPGPMGIQFQPGGRLRVINAPLKVLIGAAYGTPQPLPDYQISGGPKWIDSDRFDVLAKAEGDPKPGPNGPPPEMFLMLRSLLLERFQLSVHHETREMPIFALLLARSDGKLGPQIHPAATDCAALMAAMRERGGPPPPPAPGERLPCGTRMFPGNISAGAMTMAQVASGLARLTFVNRVVVDRTGLQGGFDFDLTYTPDQMPQGRGDPPPGAPALPPIDPNGPSIFTALQEQLGLKLESTKAPVDVLVIDRVEHPTED